MFRKSGGIFLNIILGGVADDGPKLGLEVRGGVRFAKVVLQFLGNLLCIFRPVLPKPQGSAIHGFPRIRSVEHIFEPGICAGRVDERNAFSPRLDPAPVCAFVPLFYLGAGGSVGPLGVDEKLLLERVFVKPRRRTKKRLPFFGAADDALPGFPGQRRKCLYFAGHEGLLSI